MSRRRLERAARRLAHRQGETWTLLRITVHHDDETRRSTSEVEPVEIQARAFRARRRSTLDGAMVEAQRHVVAVPVSALAVEPRPGDRLVEGAVDPAADLATLGEVIDTVERAPGEWLLTVAGR